MKSCFKWYVWIGILFLAAVIAVLFSRGPVSGSLALEIAFTKSYFMLMILASAGYTIAHMKATDRADNWAKSPWLFVIGLFMWVAVVYIPIRYKLILYREDVKAEINLFLKNAGRPLLPAKR